MYQESFASEVAVSNELRLQTSALMDEINFCRFLIFHSIARTQFAVVLYFQARAVVFL